MATLMDLFPAARRIEGHRPWPRAVVTEAVWKQATQGLANGETTLLGLWCDTGAVHMALLREASGDIAVLTLECAYGKFPSVSAAHPPALRLERAIQSLYGLEAVGLLDIRPWLDFGFWGVTHPLGEHRAQPVSRIPYAFLSVEGESLHQVPVGPVHAGIIEPGHFRFTANGETVVRVEQRLGYAHKGIEALMAGAPLEKAARLAGRASGDSTVAYALAFAQAVETALEIQPPARAIHLRALMAELERIANHLGDIGAICNDASFSLMHAQCGILRERVLRASQTCFSHRLMMDRVVPGGISEEAGRYDASAITAMIGQIRAVFPALIELYDNTTSLQDRTVGTGIVSQSLVRQFGAGGYVGRASGRLFDARRSPGYAPYDRLHFDVPVLEEGDVDARVWIRIREVEQSLSLIEQVVEQMPGGPLLADLPVVSERREGLALVEAFRGDVFAWVSLEDGGVRRCHLRDASWFQWPLLEAAIEGNIIADFPICNKSFNCSYSGHDL